MTRPYRVGIVGLGIGQGHIREAYAPHPDMFELTAVCDLDKTRLAELGALYDVPGTTAYEDLLQDPDIDIIDICTPSWLHATQARAALEAGKHVICEKPVAGSLAEIDMLARVETASPGVMMPIFQYRWGQGVRQARAIIDAGVAGRPLMATSETHWLREPSYYEVSWRGTWKGELGGTMTTHAIHIHDLLCWLFGPVSSVFGRGATMLHDIETEDCANASLRFANGAMATLSATVGSADQYSRLFLAFENVSFESTRDPYAVGRGPWKITARDAQTQSLIDAVLADLPDAPERFEGQMGAFHTTLRAGLPPPVTLADAANSVALLSAFYTSSREGTAVGLPLADGHPARNGWIVDATN